MNTAEKSTLKKSATLATAGLVVAGALLTGCDESKTASVDDAYAGNSGETEKSQEGQSQSQLNGSDSSDSFDSNPSHNDPSTTTSDKKGTGNYRGSNYPTNGQYGLAGEDSIDVHLITKGGNAETVNIIGRPLTTIFRNYQNDFAKAINGVVDGEPLKDLKVGKVIGASWTSDAFNKALEVARREASIQEQDRYFSDTGHSRSAMRETQAMSPSIALSSVVSYATKDPITVDNSSLSSTSSRNTPCATPCLRSASTYSNHRFSYTPPSPRDS